MFNIVVGGRFHCFYFKKQRLYKTVGKIWMLLRDFEENIFNLNQKLSVRQRVYFLLNVVCTCGAIYQPK